MRFTATLVLFVALAGCSNGTASPEGRATADGTAQLKIQWKEIENRALGNLTSDDIDKTLNRMAPSGTYASTISDGFGIWKVYLHATGRDPLALGEHTLIVGTCIEMSATGIDRILRSKTVACPRDLLRKKRETFDVEVDLHPKPVHPVAKTGGRRNAGG